jgi:ABC-2 type transport system ATP-binding protein
MDEAEYCHRLALMHKGQIVALDTPRALRKAYRSQSLDDVFAAMIKEQEQDS